MAQGQYTIYELEYEFKKWITTDLNEMIKFCLFMDMLGYANEGGFSKSEIPLTCLIKY